MRKGYGTTSSHNFLTNVANLSNPRAIHQSSSITKQSDPIKQNFSQTNSFYDPNRSGKPVADRNNVKVNSNSKNFGANGTIKDTNIDISTTDDTIPKPINTKGNVSSIKYTWKLRLIDGIFLLLTIVALSLGVALRNDRSSSSSSTSYSYGTSVTPSSSSLPILYTSLDIQYNTANVILNVSTLTYLRCSILWTIESAPFFGQSKVLSDITVSSITTTNHTTQYLTNDDEVNKQSTGCSSVDTKNNNRLLQTINTSLSVFLTDAVSLTITITKVPSSLMYSFIDLVYAQNNSNSQRWIKIIGIYENNTYIPPVSLRLPSVSATPSRTATRSLTRTRTTAPSNSLTASVTPSPRSNRTESISIRTSESASSTATATMTTTGTTMKWIAATSTVSSTMSAYPSKSAEGTITASTTHSSTASPSVSTIPLLDVRKFGCHLWLDANDSSTVVETNGKVYKWKDKSDFGNHLQQTNTANQPLVTNAGPSYYPSVYFSGASISLTSINNSNVKGNTERSIFMVAYLGAGSSRIIFAVGNHAGASPGTAFGFDINNMAMNAMYIPYVYNVADIIFPYSITGMHSFYAYYDSSGTAHIGGGYDFTGFISSNATLDTSDTPWYMGNRPDNEGSWASYVCEIIVYNRTLLTYERQKIEGYLAWKWGLEKSLPAEHPFVNKGPLLV